jgi:hypothetical protein
LRRTAELIPNAAQRDPYRAGVLVGQRIVSRTAGLDISESATGRRITALAKVPRAREVNLRWVRLDCLGPSPVRSAKVAAGVQIILGKSRCDNDGDATIDASEVSLIPTDMFILLF